MKELDLWNKAFENKIRLGAMLLLLKHDSLDFSQLKELLEATDGNLASHLKALERQKLISVKKAFVDNKPKTSYRPTVTGKAALMAHLDALESLLKVRQ